MQSMRLRRLSARLLRRNAVVIVGAFLVCAILAVYELIAVGHEAAVASSNAEPSLESLTTARTALRRLNSAMDFAVVDATHGRAVRTGAVDEEREEIRAALDRYRALPAYKGEADGVARVLYDLRKLDDGSVEMEAILEDGDPTQASDFAHGPWRVASDELDDALDAMVRRNARHLRNHFGKINAIRSSAVLLLVLVTALSLIATLVVSLLASAAIGRHERFLEQRAEEWEAFSGRMAHDLLSPLQAVSLALQLAAARCTDASVAKTTARGISAMKRAFAVVDALFTFARAGGRPPAGARTSVPAVVSSLLEEIRPVADDNLIELTSEAPPVEVACSEGILSILLTNLLQNAIKYMGHGPLRRITLKVRAGPRLARFEVQDTGPGLTAAEARHIFEPFVRGNVEGIQGIGLGLATVSRLVAAYGGTTGVESTKGKGSVFWFELPLAPTLTARTSQPRLVAPSQPVAHA
jgi:signal transduction histidine kinase